MNKRDLIHSCLDSVKYELRLMQISRSKGNKDEYAYMYYQRANAKIDMMQDLHLIQSRHAHALLKITKRAFFRDWMSQSLFTLHLDNKIHELYNADNWTL